MEPGDIGSEIALSKKAYTRGANHTIRHRDSLILEQGVQCQEDMCSQTSLILHYEGATKNDPLGRKLEPFQDEKGIVVHTCVNLCLQKQKRALVLCFVVIINAYCCQ